MEKIFEINDKSGRNIYLSRERWAHLNQEHPEIAPYSEEIKETLKNPLKIALYEYDRDVRYYYRYLKERNSEAKFMLVLVKYLNGEGFIITAYFVKRIK